jgi:hypothetical protein
MSTKKKKVAKKRVVKRVVPKPKPKKKAMIKGLAAIPETVLAKARQKIENMMKSSHRHSVTWKAQDTLPAIPRKKVSKKVKQASLPAVGGSYYDDRNKGGDLDSFLKRVSKHAETAQGKGATDLFVTHNGVTVAGYRDETDAEFIKRRDEAELERAIILVARDMKKEVEEKEEAAEKVRREQQRRDNFTNALDTMPKKDLNRILKQHGYVPSPTKKAAPKKREVAPSKK